MFEHFCGVSRVFFHIQQRKIIESELIKNLDMPQNKHFITIPYVKKTTEKFSRNTTKMFEHIGVKIRIAYKTEKLG